MTQITPAFLDAFGDAWNRHDTDAILASMTEDCVFQNSGGRGPTGRCYEGKAEVRKGIDKIFSTLKNVRWNNPTHFIAGDRGVTEWAMTADTPDGRIEVQGCDVFTFRDGKVAVKNSYLKQRTD
jgi:ketosteroid isomerase-like protein